MNARSVLVLLSALPLGAAPWAAPAPRDCGETTGGLARVAATADEPYIGIFIAETEAGGVAITRVIDGTPAARAGLRDGDRLVALANRRLEGMSDLFEALARYEPGDVVDVQLVRGDERRVVALELGGRRDAPAELGLPQALEPAPAAPAPDVPEAREEEAARAHREALEGRWRALIERQNAELDQWAAEFAERMADLRARMEERWRHLEEGIEVFEREHAQGAEAELGDALRRRADALRRELDRDREDRSRRIEELNRRMEDAEASRRERLERLFEERLPQSRTWTRVVPRSDSQSGTWIELRGPDGETRRFGWIQEGDGERGWKLFTPREGEIEAFPPGSYRFWSGAPEGGVFRIQEESAERDRRTELEKLREDLRRVREELRALRERVEAG